MKDSVQTVPFGGGDPMKKLVHTHLSQFLLDREKRGVTHLIYDPEDTVLRLSYMKNGRKDEATVAPHAWSKDIMNLIKEAAGITRRNRTGTFQFENKGRVVTFKVSEDSRKSLTLEVVPTE